MICYDMIWYVIWYDMIWYDKLYDFPLKMQCNSLYFMERWYKMKTDYYNQICYPFHQEKFHDYQLIISRKWEHENKHQVNRDMIGTQHTFT